MPAENCKYYINFEKEKISERTKIFFIVGWVHPLLTTILKAKPLLKEINTDKEIMGNYFHC